MKSAARNKAGQVVMRSERLIALAQQLADEIPGFFETKGPGKGDRATNSFMARLRQQAREAIGEDLSEQKIVAENTSFAVDFYFPDEGTIVEVALGLRNALSEFERDILKAILAKEQTATVKRLIFVSKPGALKRHSQPSSQAVLSWLKRNYGIEVSIRELADNHSHKQSPDRSRQRQVEKTP
jgi:hypothetical protein